MSEGATGREGLWGCTVHGAQCMPIVGEPPLQVVGAHRISSASPRNRFKVNVRVCVCVCVCASVCVADGNELVRDMTKLRTKPKQSVLSICSGNTPM